jgi:biotin carboxyl carrier protein
LESGKQNEIAFSSIYSTEGKIGETSFKWDVIKVKEGSFHIIKDNKSYNVELVNANYEEKSFTVSVNGSTYKFKVQDKYDELLKSLGIDVAAAKVSEIKAPMPGLVLKINIELDAEVKKGDTLIILEAMKMENSIKSPGDGKVKGISVKQGQAVEKNQVLIAFY